MYIIYHSPFFPIWEYLLRFDIYSLFLISFFVLLVLIIAYLKNNSFKYFLIFSIIITSFIPFSQKIEQIYSQEVIIVFLKANLIFIFGCFLGYKFSEKCPLNLKIKLNFKIQYFLNKIPFKITSDFLIGMMLCFIFLNLVDNIYTNQLWFREKTYYINNLYIFYQQILYRVIIPMILIYYIFNNKNNNEWILYFASIFIIGFMFGERQGIIFSIYVITTFLLFYFSFRNLIKYCSTIMAIIILLLIFFTIGTELQQGRDLNFSYFFKRVLNSGFIEAIFNRVFIDPPMMSIISIEAGFYLNPFNFELHHVSGFETKKLVNKDEINLSSFGIIAALWLNGRILAVAIGAFLIGWIMGKITKLVYSFKKNIRANLFFDSLLFINIFYIHYTELVPTMAIISILSFLVIYVLLNLNIDKVKY